MLAFILFVAGASILLLLNRFHVINLQNSQKVQVVKNQLKEIVPMYKAPTPTPAKPDETLMPLKLEHTAKGKLAYIKDNQIYVVNADRTGLTQLTNDKSDKYDLSVSPNGKMIAYLARKEDEPNGGGMFSRYWTNLYIYNFDTKSVHKINSGEMASFAYPNFSKDSKYITVWVTGNSKIYRIADGKVVKDIGGPKDEVATPIVFLDEKRVSYILNGKLYIDEVDNQDRDLIRADLDVIRPIHEGPSIPEPPYWSKSLRYVTYYKKGDFFLYDKQSGKEKLLVPGNTETIFYGENSDYKYPNGYPVDYINNEQDFLLIKNDLTVRYNISTGKFYDIGAFESTTQVSGDGKTIFSTHSSGSFNTQGTFYDVQSNKESTCKVNFVNDHYWWAGGTDYTSRYKTWNYSSSAVVGNGNYRSGKSDFLQILDKDTCYIYDIAYKGYSAVWLPD